MDEVEYEHLETGVFKGIITMLLRGALQPGRKLNQLELAKALCASRTPVNSVLSRLEGMMLVEKTPRHGARVRAYSREDLKRLIPIFRLLGEYAMDELRSEARLPGVAALRTRLRAKAETEFTGSGAERVYYFFYELLALIGNDFLEEVFLQLILIFLINCGHKNLDTQGLDELFEKLLAAIETKDDSPVHSQFSTILEILCDNVTKAR